MADVNISPQMQLSLNDLAMELESLGLKSAFKDCRSPTELSEYLLSSSWALINMVHCSALGLNDSKHSSDREALLLSENQSLETKLSHMKSEIDSKDKLLVKEKAQTLRVEAEFKKLKDHNQQLKQQIAQLSFKLETKEKSFNQERRKQEAESEALREIIRKSIGAGVHSKQYPVSVERLSSGLDALDLKDRAVQAAELSQSTVNRLKSVNCTLVAENLMLRDALKLFHTDVSVILTTSQTTQSTGAETFPVHVFQLPLALSMKKITSIWQEQVNKLYELVKRS